MATQTTIVTLGVDVSKDTLEICEWPNRQVQRIANEADAIRHWLAGYPSEAALQLAVEPTGDYHRVLMDVAERQGVTVYPVNPRQLYYYRISVGLRHKSDAHDAWLLARYLAHEGAALRPHQPQDPQARELWALLKRRGKAVKCRQQLQQSFASSPVSCRAVVRQFENLIARIDRRIEQLLRTLGLSQAYRHCRTIPGIGTVSAAALVAAYQRGVFASADAFVSYLGLDVRLCDSGRMRGRRKLTKQGEAEIRRVLFCSTHAARQDPDFDAYYQQQLEKGLPRTAARVVLMRKLVRIAFALITREENYQPRSAMA